MRNRLGAIPISRQEEIATKEPSEDPTCMKLQGYLALRYDRWLFREENSKETYYQATSSKLSQKKPTKLLCRTLFWSKATNKRSSSPAAQPRLILDYKGMFAPSLNLELQPLQPCKLSQVCHTEHPQLSF